MSQDYTLYQRIRQYVRGSNEILKDRMIYSKSEELVRRFKNMSDEWLTSQSAEIIFNQFELAWS